MKTFRFLLLAFPFLTVICFAQATLPGEIPLTAVQLHQRGLLAGGSTSIPITVDASPGGLDVLDIRLTDPAMAVTLQLPGGAEIGSINATANGFQWSSFQAVSNPGGQTSTWFQPGYHIVIRFPTSYTSGVYTIAVSSSAVAVESAVSVSFQSNSMIRLATKATKKTYSTDETPMIIAAVSGEGSPAAGLAVQAYYWARTPVSSVLLSSFQLLQETQYSGYKQQEWSFSVGNSGSALKQVALELSSAPAGINVQSRQIWLGDLPGASTVPTNRKIVVTVPDGTSFSPASLVWSADAAGPESAITLLDTGSVAAGTAGDGIYALELPLLPAAKYFVSVFATGSVSGKSIVRHGWMQFDVKPLLAKIVRNTVVEDPQYASSGKLATLRIGTSVVTVQPPLSLD